MIHCRYQAKCVSTWRKIPLYAAFGASFLGGLAGYSAQAASPAERTASLGPATDRTSEAALPPVLATDDAIRYRRIFTFQDDGNWPAADHEIARLNDRSLMGPVLAQRYLHRNYKARYPELQDWLAAHGDEPDARAIYALAVKRHPAGAAAPIKPTASVRSLRNGSDDEADARASGTLHRRNSADLRHAAQLKSEIRRVAETDPRKAEAMLTGSDARRLFDEADQEETRAAVAEAYLSAGLAQRALALATSGRGAARPAAEWEAGLAAWRLGRFAEARQHFEASAKSTAASPRLVAAASFWAARTELRGHRPELVNYWLGVAAQHPHTFYGLLARRTLGIDTYFNFTTGVFTQADVQILTGVPAGRRALALIQVGETARAEAELRIMATTDDTGLMEALEALADRANMPALSLQLAAVLSDNDGRNHDRALFPVPRWTPLGGFTVDRALIFALMRQESQFLTKVQSRAGAVGLMQIMPATARSMARRIGLPVHERDTLTDPEINLTLAQEYISDLQENDRIKNNLVLLAAAYNSGPAPIQRWLAQPDLRKDPLLFLESIPSRETRIFTEKVLANYWIYRLRLGQPTPDLDALAGGNWPTYTALDAPSDEGGQYASSR